MCKVMYDSSFNLGIIHVNPSQVFPNLQQQLILEIVWLVKVNPTIDCAIGQNTVGEKGTVRTLPCYHRCQNNSSNAERER